MKARLIELLSSTYQVSSMEIVFTLFISCLMAGYIFIAYKVITKSTFYSKGLNITLAVVSIITTAIIIAMKSSLVISLGMVGALSIIRFRTAIKDPLDLMFLFWSIGVGIICGAGLYALAIIVCVVVTIALLIFELFPVNKAPFLLVVNSDDLGIEDRVTGIIKQYAKTSKVKSRNITKRGLDMIIELRTNQGKELVSSLLEIEELTAISLLSHDGETRF